MKITSVIALVMIVGVFSGCIVVVDDIIPKKGNGHLLNSERDASSFNALKIEGSVEVRFYESHEYRTVVTVDSNLLEYTDIYTRGNTLIIRTKNGNYSFTKYAVDVYCPVLTGVSVSGSGSFVGNDAIETSTFNANVSGSGKIECAVECDDLRATISGSGRITVSGNTHDSDIDISGSGTFNGYNLVAHNADIHISGSGNADVYVTDYLDANISGSGKISYMGSPTVSKQISGSGKVKQR